MLATLFVAGCNRSSVAYLEKGKELFAKKSYAEASLAFRKALQKDPSCGDCSRWYAKAQFELGNLDAAMAGLRRAVALNPQDEEARLHLADLALVAYMQSRLRPKTARQEVESCIVYLMKKNSKSFDGLRLSGLLALTDGSFAEAAKLLQAAGEVSPGRSDINLALVQALFRAKQPAVAEKLALGFIDRNPAFAPMYDVLYEQYWALARANDAERILQKKISASPQDIGPLLQLAAHYYRAQKSSEMAATVRRILDHPRSFPEGPIAVGDLYRGFGRYDEAITQYQAGLKQRPDRRSQYRKRIGSVLILQGKERAAAEYYDQSAKESPDDIETRIISAALLVQTDPAAAVGRLEGLVKEAPHSAGLLYSLGRAYLARDNTKAARQAFLSAVQFRRDYVEPRLALAGLALQYGRYEEALQTANDLLRYAPGHMEGRALRGAALTGLAQYDEARRELSKVLREDPNYFDGSLYTAYLDVAERNYKAAQTAFHTLTQRAPGDIRPLNGLAELYLAQGNAAAAVELLAGALKRDPNSMPLRLSLARTAFRAGQYTLAIDEYRTILNGNPQAPGIHEGLGEAQFRSGDLNAAIATFQRARNITAHREEVLLLLAVCYELLGRKPEAIDYYTRTLQINPRNVLALNDLAYLLSEIPGRLEEAYGLATQALQIVPGQPNMADTLGWIYVQKRMPEAALQIFRKLVAKAPRNSTFQYHYAAALVLKGDQAQARAALETALRNKPREQETARIRDLLATLR